VSDTASAAVRDAYGGFKDVLRRRIGAHSAQAVKALDKAKTFHINVDQNYGAVGEFHAPVTFHQGPPVPPAPPGVG
jgi:hypothetical protein